MPARGLTSIGRSDRVAASTEPTATCENASRYWPAIARYTGTYLPRSVSCAPEVCYLLLRLNAGLSNRGGADEPSRSIIQVLRKELPIFWPRA